MLRRAEIAACRKCFLLNPPQAKRQETVRRSMQRVRIEAGQARSYLWAEVLRVQVARLVCRSTKPKPNHLCTVHSEEESDGALYRRDEWLRVFQPELLKEVLPPLVRSLP